jgi:hypothetical protein
MRIRSSLPPISFQGPTSKQWYIVTTGTGEGWIPVDRSYSWVELESMWDKVTYGKPKEVQKSSEKKTYKVEGSKGNKYTIVNDEGIWTCSCPAHGFGRGKDCKHIKNIKDGIKRK